MGRHWIVSVESAKVTHIDKYFKVIFKEKKSENEIGQPVFFSPMVQPEVAYSLQQVLTNEFNKTFRR